MRVGLGFRPELAGDLLYAPESVDFIEVVAETCYTQATTRREAIAMSERWPVIPHGVKLSLGSADGIDLDRARRLGALARELRAPMISEHVSFTRAGASEIGHLTQLPRTQAAIRVVAANVARVRRVLPDVPFLLENVAWSVRWPDDELDEPAFYHEVVAATGCDLLLDVGNLYANAVNEGLDPVAVLERYPLDRVGMIHVAGGVWEHGFYYDTHAHAVPPAVMDLVARVVAIRDVPVLVERDADISFAKLAGELAALRALPRAESRCDLVSVKSRCDLVSAGTSIEGAALEMAQAELARVLVEPELDVEAVASLRVDRVEVERARDILRRKRIDDALPLLMHLGREDRTREVAVSALAGTRKSARNAAPVDAWRMAHAAARQPELADAARIDQLLLRARFANLDAVGRALDEGRGGEDVRLRRAPFIGFARLTTGRRVRAMKGIGALAAVMFGTKGDHGNTPNR